MPDDSRWVKPAQAAKRIGVSKTTFYRMLPRLAAEGVAILKLSERITLVDMPELESWVAQHRLVVPPDPTSSQASGDIEDE